ncbi:HdeD family acid-resistance protein [Catelliglobosispora koreensis]|uniref:HdeD family acid-resistance protein n=1 Tax=Catelliglobosispora koreensis TaxID=129052 RepID=UPI00037715D4|nr:DUF308 domain-containing protein [Catelliglobosispora koreensis]
MSQTAAQVGEPEREAGKWWWVFLVTGVLWLIISLIILRFDTTSIVTIGVLVGAVILAAGVNEFITGALTKSGWRWLNFVLGAIFVVFGTIAMFSPGRTFWAMAAIIGWFLLFKGTFDIVMAFVTKHENELWWLLLGVGIIELLLAFWAAGGFGRKVLLLVVWAAAAALARGITEIITAFRLRKLHKGSEVPPAAPTGRMTPAAI